MSTTPELVDTVVIGAGQAGLAMSWHLRQRGLAHMVLERARVAERWRSERWDSLRFQFPNWALALPGQPAADADADAFASKDDVVGLLERYGAAIDAPVRIGVDVRSLVAAPSGPRYRLATNRGLIAAKQVVIATGPYQRPRLPALANQLPADVRQLHSSQYRSAAGLPAGAVLVVGTGASGCQIAQELVRAGRKVYLSVGRHRRIPRRYRGRDVIWWRRELGELDRLALAVPASQRRPAPLVSGVDGGHDVDLRRLGAELLGHVVAIEGSRIVLAPDLIGLLATGDRAYDEFIAAVDAHVAQTGMVCAAPTARPVHDETAPAEIEQIDLREAGIGSVVWATGYQLDLSWVGLPIFDDNGVPIHQDGVTPAPGVYLLGLPWLRKQQSSFLFGVGEDAEVLARRIAERSRGARTGTLA